MIIFSNLSSSNSEMTPLTQNIVCDYEFQFKAPPTAKIWRLEPQLKVSSDRLEKPGIEHGDANPDLQGLWFICYYKILYTDNYFWQPIYLIKRGGSGSEPDCMTDLALASQ